MANGSRPGRFRKSEAVSGLALISPTLLYSVLLLAAPMAAVLVYSVMLSENGRIIPDFTMANYVEVWTGRIYRAIMIRSVWVSLAVTAVTVLLAYPIAYYVSFKVPPEKKALWIFLITIPFWTSYLIRVFLWKVILGFNGVLDSGLTSIGLIDEPLNVLSNGVLSMVITLAHAYAPFAILPIYVVLEKIDRALLEAGRDLGETALRTFWRVTLPLSMSGVIAAVLIVFIPTVGDYVTPELIGGGRIPMIANLMEAQMLKQNDRAMGSAIAVTAMLVVGAITVMFLLLNRRFLRGQK